MNVCIFMGRLTADPELRRTQSGTAVTSFSLAVERRRTKDSAVTDFFDVVAWRERAEFAARYLHKGMRVAVQGEMQTRVYTDKNGVKRKAYELQAENIQFADGKQGAEQPAGNEPQYAPEYDDGDAPWN